MQQFPLLTSIPKFVIRAAKPLEQAALTNLQAGSAQALPQPDHHASEAQYTWAQADTVWSSFLRQPSAHLFTPVAGVNLGSLLQATGQSELAAQYPDNYRFSESRWEQDLPLRQALADYFDLDSAVANIGGPKHLESQQVSLTSLNHALSVYNLLAHIHHDVSIPEGQWVLIADASLHLSPEWTVRLEALLQTIAAAEAALYNPANAQSGLSPLAYVYKTQLGNQEPMAQLQQLLGVAPPSFAHSLVAGGVNAGQLPQLAAAWGFSPTWTKINRTLVRQLERRRSNYVVRTKWLEESLEQEKAQVLQKLVELKTQLAAKAETPDAAQAQPCNTTNATKDAVKDVTGEHAQAALLAELTKLEQDLESLSYDFVPAPFIQETQQLTADFYLPGLNQAKLDQAGTISTTGWQYRENSEVDYRDVIFRLATLKLVSLNARFGAHLEKTSVGALHTAGIYSAKQVDINLAKVLNDQGIANLYSNSELHLVDTLSLTGFNFFLVKKSALADHFCDTPYVSHDGYLLDSNLPSPKHNHQVAYALASQTQAKKPAEQEDAHAQAPTEPGTQALPESLRQVLSGLTEHVKAATAQEASTPQAASANLASDSQASSSPKKGWQRFASRYMRVALAPVAPKGPTPKRYIDDDFARIQELAARVIAETEAGSLVEAELDFSYPHSAYPAGAQAQNKLRSYQQRLTSQVYTDTLTALTLGQPERQSLAPGATTATLAANGAKFVADDATRWWEDASGQNSLILQADNAKDVSKDVDKNVGRDVLAQATASVTLEPTSAALAGFAEASKAKEFALELAQLQANLQPFAQSSLKLALQALKLQDGQLAKLLTKLEQENLAQQAESSADSAEDGVQLDQAQVSQAQEVLAQLATDFTLLSLEHRQAYAQGLLEEFGNSEQLEQAREVVTRLVQGLANLSSLGAESRWQASGATKLSLAHGALSEPAAPNLTYAQAVEALAQLAKARAQLKAKSRGSSPVDYSLPAGISEHTFASPLALQAQRATKLEAWSGYALGRLGWALLQGLDSQAQVSLDYQALVAYQTHALPKSNLAPVDQLGIDLSQRVPFSRYGFQQVPVLAVPRYDRWGYRSGFVSLRGQERTHTARNYRRPYMGRQLVSEVIWLSLQDALVDSWGALARVTKIPVATLKFLARSLSQTESPTALAPLFAGRLKPESGSEVELETFCAQLEAQLAQANQLARDGQEAASHAADLTNSQPAQAAAKFELLEAKLAELAQAQVQADRASAWVSNLVPVNSDYVSSVEGLKQQLAAVANLGQDLTQPVPDNLMSGNFLAAYLPRNHPFANWHTPELALYAQGSFSESADRLPKFAMALASGWQSIRQGLPGAQLVDVYGFVPQQSGLTQDQALAQAHEEASAAAQVLPLAYYAEPSFARALDAGYYRGLVHPGNPGYLDAINLPLLDYKAKTPAGKAWLAERIAKLYPELADALPTDGNELVLDDFVAPTRQEAEQLRLGSVPGIFLDQIHRYISFNKQTIAFHNPYLGVQVNFHGQAITRYNLEEIHAASSRLVSLPEYVEGTSLSSAQAAAQQLSQNGLRTPVQPEVHVGQTRRLAKFVIAQQTNFKALAQFYCQSNTDDFTLIQTPDIQALTRAQVEQIQSTLRHDTGGQIPANLQATATRLAFRKAVAGVLEDKSIGEHDWVLFVKDAVVLHPDWLARLHKVLAAVDLMQPRLQVLLGDYPSFVGFVGPYTVKMAQSAEQVYESHRIKLLHQGVNGVPERVTSHLLREDAHDTLKLVYDYAFKLIAKAKEDSAGQLNLLKKLDQAALSEQINYLHAYERNFGQDEDVASEATLTKATASAHTHSDAQANFPTTQANSFSWTSTRNPDFPADTRVVIYWDSNPEAKHVSHELNTAEAKAERAALAAQGLLNTYHGHKVTDLANLINHDYVELAQTPAAHQLARAARAQSSRSVEDYYRGEVSWDIEALKAAREHHEQAAAGTEASAAAHNPEASTVANNSEASSAGATASTLSAAAPTAGAVATTLNASEPQASGQLSRGQAYPKGFVQRLQQRQELAVLLPYYAYFAQGLALAIAHMLPTVNLQHHLAHNQDVVLPAVFHRYDYHFVLVKKGVLRHQLTKARTNVYSADGAELGSLIDLLNLSADPALGIVAPALAVARPCQAISTQYAQRFDYSLYAYSEHLVKLIHAINDTKQKLTEGLKSSLPGQANQLAQSCSSSGQKQRYVLVQNQVPVQASPIIELTPEQATKVTPVELLVDDHSDLNQQLAQVVAQMQAQLDAEQADANNEALAKANEAGTNLSLAATNPASSTTGQTEYDGDIEGSQNLVSAEALQASLDKVLKYSEYKKGQSQQQAQAKIASYGLVPLSQLPAGIPQDQYLQQKAQQVLAQANTPAEQQPVLGQASVTPADNSSSAAAALAQLDAAMSASKRVLASKNVPPRRQALNANNPALAPFQELATSYNLPLPSIFGAHPVARRSQVGFGQGAGLVGSAGWFGESLMLAAADAGLAPSATPALNWQQAWQEQACFAGRPVNQLVQELIADHWSVWKDKHGRYAPVELSAPPASGQASGAFPAQASETLTLHSAEPNQVVEVTRENAQFYSDLPDYLRFGKQMSVAEYKARQRAQAKASEGNAGDSLVSPTSPTSLASLTKQSSSVASQPWVSPVAPQLDLVAKVRKYVINLESSTKRREAFLSQNHVDDFIIHQAVRGTALSQDEINLCFDLDMYLERYNRLMSKAELGCSLSHVQILRKALNDPSIGLDDWVMVVEDDTELHPQWYRHLNDILLYCTQNFQDRPMLINGAHNQVPHFNQLEPEKFVSVHMLHGTIAQYHQVTEQVGFSFTAKDFPAGAGFYLVRKRLLVENKEILEGRVAWVADDFAQYYAFREGHFIYTNPQLGFDNPDLESLLDRERLEMLERTKKQRRLIDVTDPYPYLDPSRCYVIQDKLSDAEIAQRFPGFTVIKAVDYRQQPELIDHLFNREAYKAFYGSEPSIEIINRALAHYQVYTHIRNLNLSEFTFHLVVEEDAELVDDFIYRANCLCDYVDTRLDLDTLIIATSNHYQNNRDKVTSAQDWAQYSVFAEEESFFRVNQEQNIALTYRKTNNGANSYLLLRFVCTRMDPYLKDGRPWWRAGDLALMVDYRKKTIAYGTPSLTVCQADDPVRF